MMIAFGFAAAAGSWLILMALDVLFAAIYIPTIQGEEGYLREIRTRLCYCGPACYAFQSNSGTLLMEIQCKAS